MVETGPWVHTATPSGTPEASEVGQCSRHQESFEMGSFATKLSVSSSTRRLTWFSVLTIPSVCMCVSWGLLGNDQEPLLFRGTIRENLDPAGARSDVTLWQALRICRLSARGGDSSKSTTAPRGVRGARGAPQGASQPWYGDRYNDGSEREECSDEGVDTLGLETELEGDGTNLSAGKAARERADDPHSRAARSNCESTATRLPHH